MTYTKNILLGKITKVYGHEGAVTIRLEKYFSDNIDEMESVFIETDGRPVPFFIDFFDQPDQSTLRLGFRDYGSVDKVIEFVGCRVYLTSSGSNKTRAAEPEALTGFKVLSENSNPVGTITGLTENPGQYLLNILSPEGKEILLPFHEDLIIEIDPAGRTIRMIIPEGIADIN